MKEITYEKFIQNILNTRGRFNCGDEYHERHHIIPKCMGGDNEEENLIDLYAKEHFEAHRLLALENPDRESLVYAWNIMAFCKNEKEGQCRYILTPEEYEEVRKAVSNARLGKPLTYETRQKLSNAHKNLSDQSHENMSKAAKLRNTNEWRQKHSNIMKGKFSGAKNPNAKPVVCLDTKKVYETGLMASEQTGINRKGISLCCMEQRKTAGGLRWRLAYDDARQNGTIILGAITLGIITEEEIMSQLNITK